jgi:glycosyltransferase involved in cell wall biosynthesis
MARCARNQRVFFVEEPIYGAADPHLTMVKTADGVNVVTPYLPESSTAEQRRLLDRLVDDEHIEQPLLWFYTPMALAYAGHLRAKMTVYDCMDELSMFRGAPPELLDFERDLLQRADVVFTGGQSLYEAKRGRHPNVHAFPSSVDAAHFGRARDAAQPIPEDEQGIPQPRIGYFGVIDERIDLGLLALLADSHPEWAVVMVGPVVKIDPAELPKRPNLHYLGGKSYDELPAHLAAWDVAIMPFAENDATRFISPTKTLEYLAAGKAVVSTPIRDVIRPYGDEGLVRIGTGQGFVDAVAEALAQKNTPQASERRAAADAFVARTSWDRTWSQMNTLITEAGTRRSPENETKEVVACSIT